jgi:hypothetical protein
MNHESSSNLTALADTIEECVRSLKLMKVHVEHWDTIIIYLSVKKLDSKTKQQLSLTQGDALPTKQEFVNFLEARARALADSTTKFTTENKKITSSHHSSASSKSTPVCVKCGETHFLKKCSSFLQLPPDERHKLVTEKRCVTCLGPYDTSQCWKNWKCLICGGGHHHLLHKEGMNNNIKSNPVTYFSSVTRPNSLISLNHTMCPADEKRVILMGTFTVITSGPDGIPQRGRVFVGPGSESHFISEECVARLGLERKKTDVSIVGIRRTSTKAREDVSLQLKSAHDHYNLDLTALILPEVTGLMP